MLIILRQVTCLIYYYYALFKTTLKYIISTKLSKLLNSKLTRTNKIRRIIVRLIMDVVYILEISC